MRALEDDAIRAPLISSSGDGVLFAFGHAAAWLSIFVGYEGVCGQGGRGRWPGFDPERPVAFGLSACRALARRFSGRVIRSELRRLWRRKARLGKSLTTSQLRAVRAAARSSQPSHGHSPQVDQEIRQFDSTARAAAARFAECLRDKQRPASGAR